VSRSVANGVTTSLASYGGSMNGCDGGCHSRVVRSSNTSSHPIVGGAWGKISYLGYVGTMGNFSFLLAGMMLSLFVL
jgi:hypothetical protein